MTEVNELGLLTTEEVAEMLRCSIAGVARLRARGDLAWYRIGDEKRGRVMFRRQDLEDYLQSVRIPEVQENAATAE